MVGGFGSEGIGKEHCGGRWGTAGGQPLLLNDGWTAVGLTLPSVDLENNKRRKRIINANHHTMDNVTQVHTRRYMQYE